MKEKVSIIVFSGDMDKAMAALIIATGAVAYDMEVSMFFTFWGLQVLKKRKRTGKGFFGKMLGLFLKDISRIGPSKMNFGGLGRWMFKKMMKKHGVMSLEELLKTAMDSGVKMVACQMSMDVMEISQEDLIEGVEFGGVGSFLADAKESRFVLFI